jgi:phosphoglycolate phosphatase
MKKMRPVKVPHSAPALALFDIDGTLVRRAGPHHRMALVEAVRRVTGLETTTDHIPLHGMLDPDILAVMMRRAGASRRIIRETMPRVIRSAQKIYLRDCPAIHGKVCPGVRELLRGLCRRGAVVGLVTGNLTRIGWRKVERAGLRRYFRFGAFGEMSRDRAGLVRLAIAEARRKRWIGPDSRIFLVGDAENDIRAAQENRIPVVAVTTGISPREELASFSPDFLLEDLTALNLGLIL